MVDFIEAYRDVHGVDWFNNRRLLEPLGWLPPVEYEDAFYEGQAAQAKAA